MVGSFKDMFFLLSRLSPEEYRWGGMQGGTCVVGFGTVTPGAVRGAGIAEIHKGRIICDLVFCTAFFKKNPSEA